MAICCRLPTIALAVIDGLSGAVAVVAAWPSPRFCNCSFQFGIGVSKDSHDALDFRSVQRAPSKFHGTERFVVVSMLSSLSG